MNFDPASFTDPALFVRSLCEGFDEVLALAPDAVPTRALPLSRSDETTSADHGRAAE